MSPGLLTSQALLANCVGLAAGAVAVKMFLDQEATMAATFSPPCPTCNGAKRVPCMCSRWTDGDVGCNSCAGTGRAPCTSCGGSGKGRPMPSRVVVTRQTRAGPGS